MGRRTRELIMRSLLSHKSLTFLTWFQMILNFFLIIMTYHYSHHNCDVIILTFYDLPKGDFFSTLWQKLGSVTH